LPWCQERRFTVRFRQDRRRSRARLQEAPGTHALHVSTRRREAVLDLLEG
jgi:hypothetical protein